MILVHYKRQRARGNDKSRAKRAIITSLFIIVRTHLLTYPPRLVLDFFALPRGLVWMTKRGEISCIILSKCQSEKIFENVPNSCVLLLT